MIYLRELKCRGKAGGSAYPLNAGVLQGLDSLPFTRSVTIFCGDNGSGKTTLLSLIAALVGAQVVGDTGVGREKMQLFRTAGRSFTPLMNRRPRSSFYFTAEDFSRYLDERQRMKREAYEALEDIQTEYEGRSEYARGLARMPYAGTLHQMDQQYDRDLLAASHGEGFLSFFGGRLTQGGLYLLDEPEGALSFQNQLSLLALISSAVAADGQVIMATHSPVLAAYPKAALLEISAGGLEEVPYDGLSSLQFLQHFLKHSEHILKRAGVEEEAEP